MEKDVRLQRPQKQKGSCTGVGELEHPGASKLTEVSLQLNQGLSRRAGFASRKRQLQTLAAIAAEVHHQHDVLLDLLLEEWNHILGETPEHNGRLAMGIQI
ncbi:MAG TPA: hypothetical protein VHL58_10835 [Thermoanaerobaculia bacterium]|nr:hypothetical protein [Thermoanaerobaculia bacterium]